MRTAAAIAAWLGVGKLIWDEAEGIWRETSDPVRGDGKLWWTSWNPALQPSPEAACLSSTGPGADWSYQFIGIINGPFGPRDCNYRAQMKSNPNIWNYVTAGLYSKDVETPEECPAGWTKTPAGCVSPAVDQPRFEEILAKPGNILPERVPLDLPYPLPINLPEIAPLFIPTGNPVPNPNYNPSAPPGVDNQPWNQPGVRVTPAPVPGSPWQVDIQPINRPVDNPNPDPNPKPDPNPGDGDKPTEKDPGLCEMYPDIVACQKLGGIDAKELPKKTVPMQITKQNVGPENGSCPAPRQFDVMGVSMAFRWDLLCDFATGIRPILVGFAWLSAALAFVGLSRRGD
ncbi:virulence factor TspB C-terminal domain-related protein [Delftia tsuruhatensis]|uniref:virulence factor TspB C-terminal domain-related protein n=1 Tax=Delftia tsuruhatensis TaxID=180282 RepID=UPI001F162CFE|nr:virulence factor TspB C-terminal domain-related protein [Delftia tsuruhatensis]